MQSMQDPSISRRTLWHQLFQEDEGLIQGDAPFSGAFVCDAALKQGMSMQGVPDPNVGELHQEGPKGRRDQCAAIRGCPTLAPRGASPKCTAWQHFAPLIAVLRDQGRGDEAGANAIKVGVQMQPHHLPHCIRSAERVSGDSEAMKVETPCCCTKFSQDGVLRTIAIHSSLCVTDCLLSHRSSRAAT